MRRSGSVGAPGVLALVAALWVAPAQAQSCGVFLRAGLGVPLDDLPPRDVSFRELGTAAGGGAGFTCDGDALSFGGTLLVQSFDWITGFYLLGDVGRRWRLGDAPGAAWLRLAAVAGPVAAEALGGQPAILITGPNTELPSVGFALGASARLGVPAAGGAFFVDGALLGTFLEAEDVRAGTEPAPLGLRGFAAPLVSIGYQFTP